MAVILRKVTRTSIYQPCLMTIRFMSVPQREKPPDFKLPGKMATAIAQKYVKYMDKFEDKFEGKFPKAFKIYMLFKVGVKEFIADSKIYYNVVKDLRNGKTLKEFTYKELNTYRQMPHDMIKVAPVLVVSALPFANYVVFPAACLFPKYLLCRHFWTEEQRIQFAQYYLTKRLQHLPQILKYIRKHKKDIIDGEHKIVLKRILYKLDNDTHPSPEEVFALMETFRTEPFGLTYLTKYHKLHSWHLAKSLGLSVFRSRLISDTILLHHIDLALAREKIDSLSFKDLQQACFVRGLDASDTDIKEMKEYLSKWIVISKNIDLDHECSLSLLLHAPVFLGYNRKSNKKHLIELEDS